MFKILATILATSFITTFNRTCLRDALISTSSVILFSYISFNNYHLSSKFSYYVPSDFFSLVLCVALDLQQQSAVFRELRFHMSTIYAFLLLQITFSINLSFS